MNESATAHDKRKRVLLMATSMRGGGSEHQVALLARHLPRDRFDVHLFLTERVGELLDELPDDVPIHTADVTHVSDGSLWRRLVDRWPGTILRRHAAEFAKIVARLQIDVIYDRAFHNTLIAGHPSIDRMPDRITGRIADQLNECGPDATSQRRVRRVSTIVSPPHVALPTVEKRFVSMKRRMLAAAYQRSDVVIAVSDAAAESAAAYYSLRRDRIVVIPNPIDIDAVRRSAAEEIRSKEIRSKNGPIAGFRDHESQTCHLVCVGRMSVEKGQRDLIDAIGRLAGRLPATAPRLSLRFIGDGPQRESLQRQWAALADHDGQIDGHRVEFAGVVTPATRQIARADGIVLPSHFEGMPNVVLEAFAVQTPVIATRSGGTVQLQADAADPTCFWANPQNPESLAQAIEAFLGDPGQRARHVTTASNLLRQNHAIETAVGKIAAILAE